jgi:hypothetical protein
MLDLYYYVLANDISCLDQSHDNNNARNFAEYRLDLQKFIVGHFNRINNTIEKACIESVIN